MNEGTAGFNISNIIKEGNSSILSLSRKKHYSTFINSIVDNNTFRRSISTVIGFFETGKTNVSDCFLVVTFFKTDDLLPGKVVIAKSSGKLYKLSWSCSWLIIKDYLLLIFFISGWRKNYWIAIKLSYKQFTVFLITALNPSV